MIAKMRAFCFALSVLFTCFSAYSQTVTATWAGTSNLDGIASSASIVAEDVTVSGASDLTSSTNGISSGGWTVSFFQSSSYYYQYQITPTAGNSFLFTGISFAHSVSGSSWSGAVYYSTNNFSNSSQIGSNFSTGTSQSVFTNNSQSVLVPAGTTLTVRVYAWGAPILALPSSRYFRNKNVVISGTVCPTLSINSQPSSETYCAGETISLSVQASGAVSYQWKKGSTNISGATSATYTKANATTADAGTYSVVVTNGCGSETSNAAVIAVNPSPVSVTASADATEICAGTSVQLSASAVSNSVPGPVTVFSENFNGATNSFTKINNTTGSNAAAGAWTLRPEGYHYSTSTSVTFSSNDNSQFYLSNSDAPGNGSTTSAILQSPAFSTVGLTTANLNFYHYFRKYNSGDICRVEISTNGTNWTSLTNYTSNQGSSTNFAGAAISLASYLNQPTVYVRFKYDASFGYYWAIDNVSVTGTAMPAPVYSWTSTPAGFTSNLQNPTVTPSHNTTYTVTVTNSFGCSVSASTNTIVVNPVAVGGTISGGGTICGSGNGTLVLNGNVGNVVRWESSTNNFASAPTTIANTTATLNYSVAQTTYFRAIVQSGNCAQATSGVAVVQFDPVSVWTGSEDTNWHNAANWSCGIPQAHTQVQIPSVANKPVISADASAYNISIASGATLKVESGSSLTVVDAIASEGLLTIENNANLIQVNNVANTGVSVVKRNSSALMRQDYTIWSSPVSGQQLLAFSPQTLTNRFYTYTTATNLFSTVANPAATNFNVGTGYLIRMPNNHPVTPSVWAGSFTGTVNNGEISVPLNNVGAGQRFNAIGNPYPSPISIESFIEDNAANITGAIYFWRKTNNPVSPSYCSWTFGGGFVTNNEAQVFDPNQIIRTGQGFIVEASAAGTQVVFKNSQRTADNGNQFFRSANTVERNRIWLNATSTDGAFCQTLVGYISGSTFGEDAGIDGKFFNDGEISFYSLIESERFVIQGRPLPFAQDDVVPMGFKATSAGSFSIAIDHVDGFFGQGQDIFLRDNLTGVIHDLNSGAYVFASEAGTFNSRFEIVYQNALGGHNPGFEPDAVVVYKQGSGFVVNAGNQILSSVEVYDVLGKLVAKAKGINASETRIEISGANQVLIFKIASEDNKQVTKKVVN